MVKAEAKAGHVWSASNDTKFGQRARRAASTTIGHPNGAF
jgi:hypothetical protein